MKVSVVVPAYNAGDYLKPCVGSLLNQSMNAGEYEVVFVDDGSTDGTGERLDDAAAGHPNVRVIHIDNTGGPGGPRNLGLDAALGDYVYFLDCDDWLGPEALERMHAMAVRNGSDVLIGRMVGQGRGVPRQLFRESRDRAEILKHHLLGMLTPHKLFRTAFLQEHGIRFPEGPVRLEDHRFCMRAFFKADVISVLADYPCCYWVKRADEGNYSAHRFDPEHYFSALRKVLDIVDEHVPPGPERDRFYAHWLRGKMLRRMGGGTLLSYSAEYRPQMYAAIRELVLERFTPEIERLVPRHMRPRAALLRAGAYDDLIALAEAERGLRPRSTLETVRWDGDTLTLGVSADLIYRNGRPVRYRRESPPSGERLFWELPVALATPVPAEALDVTDVLPKSSLTVMARHRETGAEVFIPTTYGEDGEQSTVTLTGEARLHAPTASHGSPLDPGLWNLRVRMDVCGWAVDRSLVGAFLEVTDDGEVRLDPGRHASKPSTLRRWLRRAPALRRTVRLLRDARPQDTWSSSRSG